MYSKFIKRLFDFTAALLGFLIISPVFILVMVGLYFSNNGKPFFLQLRPGKNEKLFNIIKFKTMTDDKDSHGNLLPDEKRVTTLGNLVRKSSLDEIPQLLNVIKGDMSLIGPRPLLPQYLPLYNSVQKRRHEVRPGITGWAQVNGRNAITWEQKFRYDIWYVDHVSLVLDIDILFKTVKKVFVSEGINQEGEVTMKKFEGSEN